MSSVADEVELFILSLGDVDDLGRVLVASARALAAEIDTARFGEKPRSAAGAVRELRSVMAELSNRRDAEDGDDDEWGTPPSEARGEGRAAAATGVRPAKGRDAAEPEPRDVRARGRRGRKAAP